MEKTPISVLQEYGIKKGLIPAYKFLYGGGSSSAEFQWQVTMDGRSAFGAGKSKKEAKQKAAELLLQKLDINIAGQEDIKVYTPFENIIKVNVVGELIHFCVENNLPRPQFQLIHESGLSHCKTFVVSCNVSTYELKCSANSKQQAKNMVAKQMLSKLYEPHTIETIKNSKVKNDEIKSIKVIKALEMTGKEYLKAVAERMEDGKYPTTLENTSLSNYGEYFLKNVLPFSKTLATLCRTDQNLLDSHENPESVFNNIMQQLDYKFKFDNMDSRSEREYLSNLYIIQINANFIGRGSSESHAKRAVIIQALKFMVTMCIP